MVDLPYLKSSSREELTALLEDSNAIESRWAKRLLQKLDAGESFRPPIRIPFMPGSSAARC